MSNIISSIDGAIEDLKYNMMGGRLGRGMKAARKRANEFSSKVEAELAGIAMIPEARMYLEQQMDNAWMRQRNLRTLPQVVDEAILGDGLHAGIYAAARVAAGKPMPLVLSGGARVGGESFAMTIGPAFRLNSRNRGGTGGLPSENAALNYIPGAPIQPSALSPDEFQTNADLAFVIRQMLGRYANVVSGAKVAEVRTDYGYTEQDYNPERGGYASNMIYLEDGRKVRAYRVLNASGLGEPAVPRRSDPFNGTTILSFPQFIARLDQPFPFEGMKRVAVVGAGDGAKVIVEALLGVGPANHMSVPMLDWVERIDWYTGGSLSDNCLDWRRTQRGRYQALGSFLRRPDNGVQRLMMQSVNGIVKQGYANASFVNERTYDCVIAATGWKQQGMRGNAFDVDYQTYEGSMPQVARRYSTGNGEQYDIGTAANLSFSTFEEEQSTARIAENKVAIFRLAPRTAALATRLS
jgi:hypothetical protein